MYSGTVKWFNPSKGFGFIMNDNGGKDVFVHVSMLEKTGIKGLAEGQKVTFDLMNNRGKDAASNIKLI